MRNKSIELGDIYACKLPDGRYGTVKVINRIEKFSNKVLHYQLVQFPYTLWVVVDFPK